MAKLKTVNEGLIRLIVAQIEDTPEHWSQRHWVRHNCNTKFCFAGWAAFLSDMVDGSGKPTEKGIEYARSIVVERADNWNRGNGIEIGRQCPIYDDSGNLYYDYPWPEVAQTLLGLSDTTADHLFSSFAADTGRFEESVDVLKQLITEHTGIKFDKKSATRFVKLAA